MKGFKINDIINTLDSKQRASFLDYVRSPFFNKSESNLKVAEILTDTKNDQLEKEAIFELIFGKEDFNDQKFRLHLSYVTKLLEDFIAYNNWTENERQRALYAGFKKNKLEKYYLQNVNKIKDQLDQSAFRDFDFYMNHFVIEQELDDYFLHKGIREENISLQNNIENLEIFTQAKQLKNYCELLARQNVLQIEIGESQIDLLIQHLNESEGRIENTPLIKVYFLILNTIREPENIEHFNALITTLKANLNTFALSDLKDMFQFAQNYCVKKVNGGDSSFLEKLFEIYTYELEHKIILDDGILLHSHYKNIVAMGLGLNKLDWVKSFIEEYKNKITPELQQTAYNYNLAFYYVRMENYDKAFDYIQQCDFDDVYYALSIKALTIKIYYEIDDPVLFDSNANATMSFLKRNKVISDFQRKARMNLIKVMKKLFKLKISPEYKYKKERKIAKLRSDIEGINPLGNKDWVIQKLDELEAGL